MSEPGSESAGGSDQEKRRDRRISYDLPVFFYFAQGKRKPREVNYHKGYTQDVSRNGLKLLIERQSQDASERVAVGQELEMEIYLPAVFRSKPLVGRGVVVRVDETEEDEGSEGDVLAGIDFVNLDDKSRETLKQVAGTLREVTDDILGTDE